MESIIAQVQSHLHQIHKLTQQYNNDHQHGTTQTLNKILNHCERVLSTEGHQQNVVAMKTKGVALLQQEKFSMAITTLSAVHELNLKKDEKKQGTKQQQQVPELWRELGNFNTDVTFELAYAYYRFSQYKNCVNLLTSDHKLASEELPLPMQHLLAQACYNLEDYPEAAKIYEKMLQNGNFSDEEEREEILQNLSATYVSIQPQKALDIVSHECEEVNHDLLLNGATACIEMKQYPKALSVLRDAEDLCYRDCRLTREQVDIEAEDKHPSAQFFSASSGGIGGFTTQSFTSAQEEKVFRRFFNEASPLWVQRAYIYFVQGDERRAERILHRVLSQKPAAISTYAVACINFAAIRRHADFFDTYRKLRHAQQHDVQLKLTSKQKLFVKYNSALLLLHVGRYAQCRSIVDAMIKEDPTSNLGPLAMTALLLKEKGVSKAEEYLRSYLSKNASTSPTNATSTTSVNLTSGSLETQLLVAQLWLEQGNLETALHELQSIAALKGVGHFPTIATLVEGYAAIGQAQEAKAVIEQDLLPSIQKHSELGTGIKQFAANFYLQHHMHKEASILFQELIDEAKKGGNKKEGGNLATLEAGLALSLRDGQPDKAYELACGHVVQNSEELRGIASTAKNLSAREVMQTPLPRQAIEKRGFKRLLDDPSKKTQQQQAAALKKPRSRPKRRPPMDLNAPVDPERWIPMQFRTYIRDLAKRRQKEVRRRRAEEQAQRRKALLWKKQMEKDAMAAATTGATEEKE